LFFWVYVRRIVFAAKPAVLALEAHGIWEDDVFIFQSSHSKLLIINWVTKTLCYKKTKNKRKIGCEIRIK
jgi:hypothetical protein